jgi:hypothetical protein
MIISYILIATVERKRMTSIIDIILSLFFYDEVCLAIVRA